MYSTLKYFNSSKHVIIKVKSGLLITLTTRLTLSGISCKPTQRRKLLKLLDKLTLYWLWLTSLYWFSYKIFSFSFFNEQKNECFLSFFQIERLPLTGECTPSQFFFFQMNISAQSLDYLPSRLKIRHLWFTC